MKTLLDFAPLALWALLWIAGGNMLAASLFHLQRNEAAMVGLGIGLVTETWLANILARIIPVCASILAGRSVDIAGRLDCSHSDET